ncbi:MAG: 5-formyltetrahydrofolate cyclo-ligase [Desulfovibrionaceae bacterium]|nr:5-formyltetrahydrofolate cyclo-ligase [Desulfovibrionaceae bacterium]
MEKEQAKIGLRKEAAQRRAALPPAQAAAASLAMQQKLLKTEVWARARRVGLYVSTQHEASTDLLLERAWQEKLAVFLPRCTQRAGIMEFVACTSRADLRPARFNLLEPKAELPAAPLYSAALLPDLIIVPGLAFDKKGNRLGYGGGYYDRYISAMPSPPPLLLGLAYAVQIVPTLPAEAWDCPMHGICTEENITWI